MTQTKPGDERVLGGPEASGSPAGPADLQPGDGARDGDGRAADPDARLKLVARTRKAYIKAREAYIGAVLGAVDADVSPTTIAEAAGVTEGAIRQTVKRNR